MINKFDNKNTIDSNYVNYPQFSEYDIQIKVNGIPDRIEIFDISTHKLKRIQYYSGDILDSMRTFFEDGKLKSINTFSKYHDNMVDNTWIYFTENGDTINDISYYYVISNSKKFYYKGESATITFNINKPKFGEILYINNDLNSNTNDKISNLTFYELKESNRDDLMTLYVPTDTLGQIELKFTISDCFTIGDSVVQCRPMKGVFKYEVINK